jgi:hypothetical protein
MLCPQKYDYGYNQGYWSRFSDDKMDFGKAWHSGLERYWGGSSPLQYYTLNESDRALLQTMLKVYGETYDRSIYQVNGIEEKHQMELAGHPLTVVLDAHVSLEGHNALVESKTTRADIENDWYWMKLDLDHQIALYVWAVNKLGLPTTYVIYDVVRVPPLKLGKVGRKVIEETVEEFKQRCYNELTKNNDKYYQRRTHKPNVERAIKNVESWLKILDFCDQQDIWPMDPNNCKAFGRRCEYHSVCTGQETLEESNRLEKNNR